MNAEAKRNVTYTQMSTVVDTAMKKYKKLMTPKTSTIGKTIQKKQKTPDITPVLSFRKASHPLLFP